MKTKLTPIAAAAAVALAGAVAPVFAQSAAAPAATASAPAAKGDDGVQRVEVTGIRASVQAALSQKRNADSLVEVITAEDVGKMPDKNVADSLQRLPGVYTATAGGTEGGFGENDRVSVRGAPSALTLTTLNGHTVSSGDWYSANITGGGRSVSYSLLPSELIGNVIVHKTAQADLIEGGAVGTVDIQTRKPLDFAKALTVEGSAEAVYSAESKKTDPQLSALVSWHNEAKTFGILAQAFSETRHLRRDGQEFLWWDTVNDLWGGNAAVLAAHPDLSGKMISGLTGSVLFEQTRKREGGYLDVEAKPTAGLTLNLTGFYSRLEATNENHNYMFDAFNPITAAGISPSSYTIKGNTVTSLTFPTTCPAGTDCSGASSSVQDIAVRPGAQSNSQFINLDGAYTVNDQLGFTGLLGHTSGYGRTKDIGFEVWSPYVGGSYTTHGLGSTADVSVPGSGTYSIGGAQSTVGGWASYVDAIDKENYGQVDGTWKTNNDTGITEIKFGARAASHKRNLTDVPGTLSTAGTNPANAPLADLTTFPSDFADSLPGGMLRDAWTLPGSAITQWAAQNITFSGHTPQSEFSISEPSQSAYAMASFDTGMMSGNFGLRMVDTTEKVTNNALISAGVYAPVTVTNHYFDALPSVNIKLDLTKNLVSRFAVSRTMSRPDFGELGGLSLLDVQMTGTGGNPNLKPIRSNNFDFDLEYYFGENKKSLVSAGVYYMNFDSYVTFGSFQQTFYNQSQKAYTVYQMSAPTNTTAELKGLELNYIGDLGYGFGVQANYTLANGRETGKAPASACATNGDCDMIGTSKNTYNLGAYYENDLLSARVTYNHRSAYLNGLDRNSAIYQSGVGTVSASLDVNVTKNFTVTFEGKDLNNPLLKSYASTPDQPRAFYKNGAQYYAGVRAQF